MKSFEKHGCKVAVFRCSGGSGTTPRNSDVLSPGDWRKSAVRSSAFFQEENMPKTPQPVIWEKRRFRALKDEYIYIHIYNTLESGIEPGVGLDLRLMKQTINNIQRTDWRILSTCSTCGHDSSLCRRYYFCIYCSIEQTTNELSCWTFIFSFHRFDLPFSPILFERSTSTSSSSSTLWESHLSKNHGHNSRWFRLRFLMEWGAVVVTSVG